ncbi:6-bladed beta-propeller [Pedobacter frigoris]|uniref:6-bladed beta-propeller n=1 Tax=Pedobacter frigoris TaxID=2571272 RepID=A0A4U1CJK6_9SPHI|nr:6-bladed beta-propeller [Pedobacter frigoris]TKC07190.1 6-bladed beta-propeller [Pedobacter frigoris]
MQKKYFYHLSIILIITFFYAGCSENVENKSLNIDITSYRTDTNLLRSSKIYDSVVYIPLETNSRNLIAKIDQLEIESERYIVLDKDSKTISIYTKTGKFINLIENVNTWNFWIDNHLIKFFNSKKANEILAYNLDGEEVSKSKSNHYFKNIIELDSISHAEYYGYDRSNYAPYNSHNLGIFKGKEYKFFLNNENILLSKENVISTGRCFFRSDSITLFTPEYSTEIFSITPTSCTKKITIKIDKEASIPLSDANFLKDLKYNIKHGKYIVGLNNCFEANGVVSFQVVSTFGFFNFIYNINQQKLLKTNEIFKYSVFKQENPIGIATLGVDNGSFISSMPASFFVKMLRKSAFKESIAPFATQYWSELNKVTVHSNPVLIKAYPKKNWL